MNFYKDFFFSQVQQWHDGIRKPEVWIEELWNDVFLPLCPLETFVKGKSVYCAVNRLCLNGAEGEAIEKSHSIPLIPTAERWMKIMIYCRFKVIRVNFVQKLKPDHNPIYFVERGHTFIAHAPLCVSQMRGQRLMDVTRKKFEVHEPPKVFESLRDDCAHQHMLRTVNKI